MTKVLEDRLWMKILMKIAFGIGVAQQTVKGWIHH